MSEPVLSVRELETHLYSREGTIRPVNRVSFDIHQGETLGIVGESGSGKTMTALSIMGLIPKNLGGVVGGSVVLDGEDLAKMTDTEVRRRRSTKMGMIFQDPATSLNPTMKVGPQIAETMKTHLGINDRTARNRTIELLDRVGIPSPEGQYNNYPFQFSGGMRQRVMIAIALSCDPLLLIADEPTTALDPRQTVGEAIAEPIRIHRIVEDEEVEDRVEELLKTVGLNPYFKNRYPHEFSGGQQQRIVIARALSVNPTFIVADEPISALDVSIQAQIINLLEELQDQFQLTYLFISHDLRVVRHISDRVADMYLGKVVERSATGDLYSEPLHPYTRALLSGVPAPDPELARKRDRIILVGDVPSPINPPSGCRFRTRCPIAIEMCAQDEPPLEEKRRDHWAACHLVEAEAF